MMGDDWMDDDDKPEVVFIKEEKTDLLDVAKYLVSVTIFCLIGLAINQWLFVPDGAATLWGDFGTYMVMIFWPFILLWKFMVIMFWITLIVLVVGGAIIMFQRLR